MNLTYAEIKLPEGMNLPQRYRKFVIKLNGMVVGEMAHTYYPKNDGGSRWAASYREADVGGDPVGPTRTVSDKQFNKVLVLLRDSIEETVRRWDFDKDRLLAHRSEYARLEAMGMKPCTIAEIMWERDSIGDQQT